MNLVNKHYDDCYFSIESGYLESRYVFIDGNFIQNKLDKHLKIGETGFGTGLNLLVLEDFIKERCSGKLKITFTSVEKYPLEPEVVLTTLNKLQDVNPSSLKEHLEIYNLFFSSKKHGWNTFVVEKEWGDLTLNIYVGDVLDSFVDYPVKNSCWFLDGHSPDKNPEMWCDSVFENVAKQSVEGCSFATFTAAGIVKRGLRNAGFFVKRRKGFGEKRHMILGSI